jgi:putative FmdB family regulatory protein
MGHGGDTGMPIFEYICKGCGHKFEAIVMGENKAECPTCHGGELQQQLSTFSAHSHSSSSSQPMAPCGMPGGSCGNCHMN